MKERTYQTVAPFVPLTFNPDSDRDLREIEEVNDLPEGSIAKARWIKPQNRRAPTQTVGHAMISLTTPEAANQILLKGILICHKRILPQKNRKEPTRCLKCHRYGHIAANCQAIHDTCGTCGHAHRTAECDRDKTIWCVSCNSSNHSSWDRFCPSFIERCEDLDSRYAENMMPYFPTDEPWTLVSSPPKHDQGRGARRRTANPQPPTPPNTQQTNQRDLRQTRLPFHASQRAAEGALQRTKTLPPHAASTPGEPSSTTHTG